MSRYYCVSVTFLDGRFHGRVNDGSSEWPPSPLRLFQAIVNANAFELENRNTQEALRWLEGQPPPSIVAPHKEVGTGCVLSVPNNAMDIVGRAWSNGNYFGIGDSNPATHRAMKRLRPVHMTGGETAHYLWRIGEGDTSASRVLDLLIHCAKQVFRLGWGTDVAVVNAQVLDEDHATLLQGEWWKPNVPMGGCFLRTPHKGTLGELRDRHEAFLNRIGPSGFVPVAPMIEFANTRYRRSSEAIVRPHVLFELRNDNGSFFRYPQSKLIHIAGMVRHLAIDTMKTAPPPDSPDDWIETYVAGHVNPEAKEHRQLSYLPLISIGHEHTDPAVRRVMIVAPLGDDAWLEHLARRLEGRQLKPERGNEFGGYEPPTLVRIRHDRVTHRYTSTANNWASVTPVILPGYDDHKPAKTQRLIEKALAQAGIAQPCKFQWSPFSRFPKLLSAHKYNREKKPTGYIRPDYLSTQTAVHLTLRFDNGLQIPGPLAIGAGRHCGFGVFAAND